MALKGLIIYSLPYRSGVLSPGNDFLCLFHYNTTITSLSPMQAEKLVRAEVLPIWNTKNSAEYCPVFINCPIPRTDQLASKRWPISVSIIRDLKDATLDDLTRVRPGNNVRVVGSSAATQLGSQKGENLTRRRELAFCVKKLRFNFGDVVRMVEFMEMYALLGVDRVYLYGSSYTSKVGTVYHQSGFGKLQ